MLGRWLSFSRSGPRKLPRFHRCLECLHQSGMALQQKSPVSISSYAAFIIILLVTNMCPSGFLALRKKDLIPPLAPSLVFVDRDRSFRNWSVTSTTSFPHSRREIRRKNLEFRRLFNSSKKDQNGNRHFVTQRHDHVHQTHHSGASIRRVRVFRTAQ